MLVIAMPDMLMNNLYPPTAACSRMLIQQHHACRHDAVNPLKPNSSNYYTLPYRPNLPFLASDIRALWHSALNARVPECQKLKMASKA